MLAKNTALRRKLSRSVLMPVGIAVPVRGQLIMTILILECSPHLVSHISIAPYEPRATAVGWPALPLRAALSPAGFRWPRASSRLQAALQDPREALLDWLGRFGRNHLREFPKLAVLRRCEFQTLAALRGRKAEGLRNRLGSHQLSHEFQCGAGVLP